MSGKLNIGWAEVDLTPNKKVGLAGQFAERISEYVESPVTATAMAVEVGGEQMVICSCDLVSVDANLLNLVRSELAGKVKGLDPARIILSATHTHTSVAYTRTGRSSASALGVLKRYLPEGKTYVRQAELKQDVMDGDEALKHLVAGITSTVQKAWNDRRPATMANEFGRAVVGHCRRVVFNDGTAQMWGDTNQAVFEELEAGSDSGVELLYVFDEQSKLRGVVANIACPAQCVQHRHFVSSDFWGETKRLLREKFGDELFLLSLCAAAGDQCPVDMIRWVDPESPLDDPNIARDSVVKRKADPSMFDIAGKKKTGKRIADEIIAVYDEAVKNRVDQCVFMHKVDVIELPVRRVTITEYDMAVRAIREFIKDTPENVNFNDNARMHIHAGVIARFEYQRDHDLCPVETHFIRLGNVAIATNPFELFLKYGNQIRARSLAEQTFIIQLACGCEGYLPTEHAEKGGHYSAYVSSGITGHEGGDLLVRHTLERINECFRDA